MNAHPGTSNTNRDDPAGARQPPATSALHPRIYAMLVGFALWFALAVWGFAGSGVTDYLLVIVSGFILVAVALQLILSRVGRGGGTPEADGAPPSSQSLQQWATSDFDAWQEQLSGAHAAAQILLPIAAAAVGMTAFGIVFHFAERGGL